MFVAPMSINTTLLDDINTAIALAGGRHRLAWQILEESPEYFTHDLRQSIFQGVLDNPPRYNIVETALLDDVNEEIVRAGGAAKLGYAITNIEAPEWFDHEIKKHFQWRRGSLLWKLNKNAIAPSPVLWTEEQIAYLKDNWKRFDVRVLSSRLGKTVPAIRFKARKIMTAEEYAERFYNRKKRGVIYKEKSKNWKRYAT